MLHDMNDGCPILIIEDDPSSQRLLERTLKAAGYHVVSSQNGLKALEVLEKNFFQIVITDWEMPGMNGLEVCRAIRSRNYEWHVYIIILTVKDSKDEIVA